MLAEFFIWLHLTLSNHEGELLWVIAELFSFVLQSALIGPREHGAAGVSVAFCGQGDFDVVNTFEVRKVVEVLVSRMSILLELAHELPVPTFICLFNPWLVLQIFVE